jgi:peptidoglycan/LPS O-acetylase OafA/YrhL
MPRNKRLHFKDIDGLRALAFLPVYLFCILKLIQTQGDGIIYETINYVSYLLKGSMDFFFMMSAFLATSHALREYKYLHKFSFKNFLIRRVIRILPLLIVGLVFAFQIHPWLVKVLALRPIAEHSMEFYLFLVPNYFVENASNDFIYLGVIASIYMFIQYYLVWGIVLKFLIQHLVKLSMLLILVGITFRIIHFYNDSNYFFDTFAYAAPMGIGSLLAYLIREDHPIITRIKATSKRINIFFYSAGILLLLIGYIATERSIVSVLMPVLLTLFFAYIVIEQTFSKTSFIKFRKKKIMTHLGRINYGMVVYQSIIGVLIMIVIESLDFKLDSAYVLIGIVLAGYISTWIVADLSYNLIEKPLMRFRREFKQA